MLLRLVVVVVVGELVELVVVVVVVVEVVILETPSWNTPDVTIEVIFTTSSAVSKILKVAI